MSIQRDPHGGNIQKILDRLYTLERQAVLAHSSIGREGLEVYDGGWIKILNGGLEVIGSAYITGRLISNGENIFNGTTEINGPTTVAGDFSIEDGGLFRSGSVEIQPDGSATFGELGIDPTGKLTAGLFELNPDGSARFGDMTIDKDGLITTGETKIDTTGKAEFGDFIIDPNSNFPIQAPGGKMVSGGPGQIGLTSDTGAIDLSPTVSQLSYNTTVFSLSSAGAQLIGQLVLASVPSAPAGDLIPLGIDSNGNVRRIA